MNFNVTFHDRLRFPAHDTFLQQEVQQRYDALWESAITKVLHIVECGMPSDDVLTQHGRFIIGPAHTSKTFEWRGMAVLREKRPAGMFLRIHIEPDLPAVQKLIEAGPLALQEQTVSIPEP